MAIEVLSETSAPSVYVIRNRVNDKHYVGQTVQGTSVRWKRHLWDAAHGSQLLFHRAIRRHGAAEFAVKAYTLPTLFRDRTALDFIETDLIAHLHATDRARGYNVAIGGSSPTSGRKHTRAERAKIGAARRGHKHTPETRAKMRGHKRTPETRARLSIIARERQHSMTLKERMRRLSAFRITNFLKSVAWG